MIREVESIQHRKKYTLPFNESNLQKLYDMRNGKPCDLVIKDESAGDKPPYSVENYEQFKTKPFDEPWKIVTTPKHNLGN